MLYEVITLTKKHPLFQNNVLPQIDVWILQNLFAKIISKKIATQITPPFISARNIGRLYLLTKNSLHSQHN